MTEQDRLETDRVAAGGEGRADRVNAEVAAWAAVGARVQVGALATRLRMRRKHPPKPILRRTKIAKESVALRTMTIAVASGKGGTGKTTVATNLAAVLQRRSQRVTYVDCDVEAPNGHLFLRPAITRENIVSRLVPQVDQERCLGCGACSDICRFNAIVCLPDRVMVSDDLCHSCGGCVRVCPVAAITDKFHPMGVVKTGIAGGIEFVSGTLNVGEASCPPVIRSAKKAAPSAEWTILDAPPGIACPMLETVRGCDYLLLVTEPTPFGLHDLRLAVEAAKALKLPCGAILNRVQQGADATRVFCEQERVPILAEIPDSLAIAEAYSQGKLVVDVLPEGLAIFNELAQALTREVQRDTVWAPKACEALRNTIPAQDLTAATVARHSEVSRAQHPARRMTSANGESSADENPADPIIGCQPIVEIVVLSGKGGTGKTSVTASLAALAGRATLADCDADASNLPLVLDPQMLRRVEFSSGLRARIDPDKCTACGLCRRLCRFDAISPGGPAGHRASRTFYVDPSACEGCGVCSHFCPLQAIDMLPAYGGEWFISETRFGSLVHARLEPGQGNSGKLAALVRAKARRIACETGHRLLLIDGPPGVGCPVMAALTGASMVLAVSEPTPSGEHDLERVLALARHFEIPVWVCINKHDLNPAVTVQMERRATELGATILGRIPYDPAVTAAQRQGTTVVEYGEGLAACAIRKLWQKLSPILAKQLKDNPATEELDINRDVSRPNL